MSLRAVGLLFWDPKRERKWWPDFIFVPVASVATLWFFTQRNWLLGILAGIVVLSLDELLWYLLVGRKRPPTDA